MALTKERRGEIAEVFVEKYLLKKGFYVSDQISRELGNFSKETGIPVPEIKEFCTPLFKKVLEKSLS